LPEKGADAQLLLHHKDPRQAGFSDRGDFAAVASTVLKNYLPNTPSSFTVGEINEMLDNLAKYNSENQPSNNLKHLNVPFFNILSAFIGLVDELLENLLRKTSAIEQKWLIRMLLKSVRFGLGRRACFYALHLDAERRFDARNSLRDVKKFWNQITINKLAILQVCETLRDPLVRLNETEICLGLSFSPMLSDKVDIAQLGSFFGPDQPELYVETKLDGERVQIHYQNTSFRYFSRFIILYRRFSCANNYFSCRNGFDFSSAYGSDATSGSLTSRLVQAILPNVSSFILDGEMMVWDTAKAIFKQKGEN
jgi:DNA ligase 4